MKKLFIILTIVLTLCIMLCSLNVFAANHYMVGDFNCDDKFNAKDSLLLRQYLTSWDMSAKVYDVSLADVDENGTVNMKDSLALRVLLTIGI